MRNKFSSSIVRCQKLLITEGVDLKIWRQLLNPLEIFCCRKQTSYCRKEIVLPFLQLEQNVFCITINDLRSLAFKVAELNHFPHTPNEDRYRWKQILLWAHETTPTTKSEAATF
jgi:hypothetical protein